MSKKSFEKQMERLQAIVNDLERGDVSLEKSIALFKEGQTLVAGCRKQIEDARRAVTIRTEQGVEPFATGAAAPDGSGASPDVSGTTECGTCTCSDASGTPYDEHGEQA